MLKQMIVMLIFGFPVPPEMVDPRFPDFLQRAGGLLLTLLITASSLLIGSLFGTILALGRRGSPTETRRSPLRQFVAFGYSYVSVAIIELIRGLPIMLLVLLIFYLPYQLIEVRLPSFVLAVTAFSVYAGAYLSEILRAGFRSVDPGLREVGQVLGLARTQILLKIELPVACRTMMPDLINLAITVLKDTSTLAVVAVPEITYVARQLLTSMPMGYELAMFLVLVLYWAPATILSIIAFRAKRRWRALTGAPLYWGGAFDWGGAFE